MTVPIVHILNLHLRVYILTNLNTPKRRYGQAGPLPRIEELHRCITSATPIDLENLFKAHAIDYPSGNHFKPDPKQNTGSVDGNSINTLLLQPLVVKDNLEGFALNEGGVSLSPCYTWVKYSVPNSRVPIQFCAEVQQSSILESPLEMLTLLDW